MENTMEKNYDVEFKNTYNKLEKYVRDKYHESNFSEDMLRNEEFVNDIQFWKNYRNLRNIITHNENITHIAKEGYEIFKERVDRIINPPIASKICTKKLYTVNLNKSLSDVLSIMKQHAFSNIPILNKQKMLEGIFNYYTLYLYISSFEKNINIDLTKVTIGELKNFYGVENNKFCQYKFISKKENLKNINKIYKEIISKGEKFGALLVTENGTKKERLIGIITKDDLIRNNA